MTPLPLDWCRCTPAQPDHNCKNCKRWWHHPRQINGERTSVVHAIDSRDEACMYIPISLLKDCK